MSFRFVFKHEIGRLSSPSFVATSVAVPQLDILDLQGVAPVLRSQNVTCLQVEYVLWWIELYLAIRCTKFVLTRDG